MTDDDLHEPLQEEYVEAYQQANDLGRLLCGKLELLTGGLIALNVPVHYRIKSWYSIVEKIGRRGNAPKNLSEIPDLVGVRIVVQFRRDLPLACELVWRHFDVVEYQDAAKRLQAEEFGYGSSHFIVRRPGERSRVTLAEIQVRTTAQHAWAASSHVLQYKHEHDIPIEIRRSMSRVAALLELSDLEFDRVFAERERYFARIGQMPADDLELNADVVCIILDHMLPRANRSVQDDYSAVAHELASHGVQNAGQLRQLVSKQLAKTLAYDAQVAEVERARIQKYGIKIPSLDGPVAMRLESNAFATHVGLLRVIIHYEYDEFYRDRT
jgi:ppGpp synthetase/RelA/SpoT-type nucleotidyltranferase